jgi:hypothetical protein
LLDRWRCATESVERGEALTGTASRVRRWVVVEQPGPWGRHAVVESRLPADVGRALEAKGKEHGVRVLLARRPGWKPTGGRVRCFLARTGRSRSWLETVDVTSPAELLTLDWSALASPGPPGLGAGRAEPLYLVCTNGRHDACCADFGRPVVRALASAGIEAWEVSHVGGDRFAANVVCLPDGVYFGRVEPAGAARLLREHGAGRIDLTHYRGRSCYSPLLQSAERFVREDTGVLDVYGPALVGSRRLDADTVEATFRLPTGDDVTVAATRRRAAAVPLTCTSGEPLEPWEYRRA